MVSTPLLPCLAHAINIPPQWRHPESGWTCLHVDGAVSTSTNNAAVGGLLRDCSRQWISGFQRAIEKCKPLQTELWAILVGLQFAWNQGVEILQIQSDCAEAVKMVNAMHVDSSPLPLVRAIAKLRRNGWVTDII
ncbi:hypothetical protein like AT5G42905 [Hibiscus trionum]|uniref:RNase H type-1 domain-containing protein n=1 Tax=Hibiscus trionum TaxID=183268 RepID=A0A9W7GW57_HIBTR|nr:hypothetical protein like AT5G42905 [Hibiscus trionum]